jgi:beta-xylosidase
MSGPGRRPGVPATADAATADTVAADTVAAGTVAAGTAAADTVTADTVADQPWRDPSRSAGDRVADLLARMTLDEKVAQLAGIWVGTSADGDGDGVAPLQDAFAAGSLSVDELIRGGLGQLTRVFGTAPVKPAAGAATLARLQERVAAANRFGIPAIAHEECLTGFATWSATAFPTPLAWGATFDPDAVLAMAAAIGQSMRAAGVHLGLAPVLDVVRDPRWGRTEETMGEDPYLAGVLGTAYVRGLQSAGVHATLKHFAGYSASRAGRNLAPADIGPRALGDVILPPFEMAIRDGGARCVMASYTSLDNVPASADAGLLTRTLREEFGFDGVVVADYFGIAFLHKLHRVAGSPADAGALALAAGIDMELPHVHCYGPALAGAVRAGQVPEALVDRAAARVLRQKLDLGLLDPDWSPEPPGGGPADLDPPAHRALARQIAEEAVVLLANDGPALPAGPVARLAVVGPLADDPLAFFGCYTFPRHVGTRYPGHGPGMAVSSLRAAVREEFPDAAVTHARGCDVRSADRSGFASAVAAAREADLVVAVVGDEAGLFGRGTSGEGCDAADLRLPGVQEDLVAALLQAGPPVVLVVVSGRPYALGPMADGAAAIVQAFFPGEEGAGAIAGVLSGRVVPSGKLPVEVPYSPGAQPSGYLRPPLAGRTEVSSIDPTPLFPFGHGLSYTSFEYSDLTVRPAAVAAEPGAAGVAAAGVVAAGVVAGVSAAGDGAAGPVIGTDGAAEIGCTVRNTGERAGTEVVQLYLGDPVAQVVRPVRFLAGFARVPLEPGQARRVVFTLHADRTAFCGRSGARIVEPGLIEIQVGSSSADARLTGALTLHGPERTPGPARVLTTPVTAVLINPQVRH